MRTMKKIFAIVVAILTLTACVRDEFPTANHPERGEGSVLVEASIAVPAMQDTRSFADPKITSLHLLVFDENGYLVQVCDAAAVGGFGVEKDKEYKFLVELGQSNYKRTIHLVANSPVAINEDGSSDYILGEHERRVINTLYTEGGAEAYWARVVLEDGIIGEQAVQDGKAVFVPSAELKKALTRVPMVRNYTRVKLTNKASQYLDDAEIMMANVPDCGSVAPLINDGNYASFAERVGTTNREYGYDDISAQGYVGYEPGNAQLTATAWGTMHEIYERHQQSGGKAVATPAYAIVRGRYVGASATDTNYSYYKVDICYTNDATGAVELYNLLRNIEYNIIITDVAGRGYGTMEEAAAGAASNNLNFAVETKNLNNISDGERRLSVEYTQRVLTEGEALFTLKYKYETNIKTGATNNAAVTFSNLVGNVLAVNNASGTTDTQKYVVSNVTGADGWNTVTFKSQAISGTKIQTIILTAGNLQRGVELILGKPYTMVLDMVPGSTTNTIAKGINKSIDAMITLPQGLPEALFPLQINLVAEAKSLSPDQNKNTIPVISGLNANGVPTSDGNYFGYVLTIEDKDYYVRDKEDNITGYNPSKTFHFRTSCEESSSKVNVYNPYFEIASDSFTAN